MSDVETDLRLSEKEHAKQMIDNVTDKDEITISTEYGRPQNGVGRVLIINIQIEKHLGPDEPKKDDYWSDDFG